MTDHRIDAGFQGPTNGKYAVTYGALYAIVCHPAFRLGFLDLHGGRPVDHDLILDRIERETPAGALKRLGWKSPLLFGLNNATRCELAQYRYEEGRLLASMGVRCKAWGHPDYPPVMVRDRILEMARERWPEAKMQIDAVTPSGTTIVAALRSGGLPLFGGGRA